jgi:diaminopimelate epimerase
LIKFVESVKDVDVTKEGAKMRYSNRFNRCGINVNFVQTHDSKIEVRTYERGVENETFSCGTGIVAAAIAYAIAQKEKIGYNNVVADVKGGKLEVRFEKKGTHEFRDIWLVGDAEFVFSGNISV